VPRRKGAAPLDVLDLGYQALTPTWFDPDQEVVAVERDREEFGIFPWTFALEVRVVDLDPVPVFVLGSDLRWTLGFLVLD
jgi:hypothetical protein